MLTTVIIVILGTHLLAYIGIVEKSNIRHFPLFLFCLASIMIGSVLAAISSKVLLRSIRDLIDATDRITNGDYSVRLDFSKGPEDIRMLGAKFNRMAEEIGSVEMLRTDFVNNFSHEFKTPLVSIRGFAKALKWDDLSPEEREEYLDIIISECERLSSLSANVLYLSKIENQLILTDRKQFDLSEQIRLVIALIDQKLTDKQINLVFDSREYYVNGNEEMLKQVWINLLDNAVKFSPEGGRIEVEIQQTADCTSIRIFDEGCGIPPEMQAHIFDRFYQGDLSHSTDGNGLGLAIVKKIVDLHDGDITVHSSGRGSIFEITLGRI